MTSRTLEQARDALRSLFSGQYDPDRPMRCSAALAAIEAELAAPEPVDSDAMTEIDIADDDVYWTMTWGKKYPDKPETERMFEDDKALARLLAEGVVFLNSHWWEEDWPERAKKITSLNVNCNDIFAWGCADAEEMEYDELQGLYDLWFADRTWGAAKWCASKRKQQPQPPVIASMKKAGVWDASMEALAANTQDAEVQAAFKGMVK